MIYKPIIHKRSNTKILGNEFVYFPKLPSTNTEAVNLYKKGKKEGTVVITDNQYAGKGRMGRLWTSTPNKSLTFSVILEPKVDSSSATLLPLMSGISVIDAICKLDITPTLKWPNDILIHGKKCGGILVESKFTGNVITSAVVGIGINVNERVSDFPVELKPIVTSLYEEKGTKIQKELLLTNILNELNRWYHRFKTGERESIIYEWHTRCNHIGKRIVFHYKRKISSGIFTGVDKSGRAIIETESGKLYLTSEEISLLRED